MSNNWKKRIFHWHRKTGILAVLPLLIWATSGLTHIMMSNWLKPELRETEIPAENILKVEDDKQRAIALASHFHKTQETPLQVTLLEEFDPTYKKINQYLPVYRVTFERPVFGEYFIYSPLNKLTSFNDANKHWMLKAFDWLHNWSFLSFAGPLQPVVMVILLGFIAATAILGLLVYTAGINQSKKPIRKWHRILGLIIFASTLAFALSGIYQAVYKRIADPYPQHFKGTLPSDFQDLSTKEQIQWMSGKLSTFLPADSLMVDFSIKKAFDREYGFINKRLPVYKVNYRDDSQTTAYLDPATGDLVAKHTQAGKVAALSFTVLHKYMFLNFLGKANRDLVIGAIILLICLMSLSGLCLWLRTL